MVEMNPNLGGRRHAIGHWQSEKRLERRGSRADMHEVFCEDDAKVNPIEF